MKKTPWGRRLRHLLLGLVPLLLATTASAAGTEEYVAMGDSFAAGNGTGFPDIHYDCNRTSAAYAPIIARERVNTSLKFVACSGATTDDVKANQVSALSRATRYVTLSVGGNDVGFRDLIINCANSWDEWMCLYTVDQVNQRIEQELPAKLDGIYGTVKTRARNATIMVVGYPRFFGSDLSCSQASGISATEASALNALADNMDRVISERAALAGLQYLRVIDQFSNHDVCASVPYVNGKDVYWLYDVYHPTAAGYRYGFMPLIRAIMG